MWAVICDCESEGHVGKCSLVKVSVSTACWIHAAAVRHYLNYFWHVERENNSRKSTWNVYLSQVFVQATPIFMDFFWFLIFVILASLFFSVCLSNCSYFFFSETIQALLSGFCFSIFKMFICFFSRKQITGNDRATEASVVLSLSANDANFSQTHFCAY